MNELTYENQVHGRHHHGDRPRDDGGAHPRPEPDREDGEPELARLQGADGDGRAGRAGRSLPIDLHDYEANTTAAKGLGEPATVPAAPAIANAIYHACGVRTPDAPVNPARLVALLSRAEEEGVSHGAGFTYVRATIGRGRRSGSSPRRGRGFTRAAPTCWAACATRCSRRDKLVSLVGPRGARTASPPSPAGGLRIGALTTNAEVAARRSINEQLPGPGAGRGGGGQPAAAQPGDDRRQHLPAAALLVLPRRLPLPAQGWGHVLRAARARTSTTRSSAANAATSCTRPTRRPR